MHVIALSLKGGDSQYESLFETMKALGPWSNRLGHTWLVQCRLNPRQVRDLLKPHLLSGDRVFVGTLTSNWAATGTSAGFADWLRRRDFGDG